MRHAGISTAGRSELARILVGGRRFVTTADASAALEIDADAAAKRMSRWAEYGWLRRVRRGLYISGAATVPPSRLERKERT
jgi:predicted transcriptional regulator of viral defense system